MPELTNRLDALIEELKMAKIGPAEIGMTFRRLGQRDARATAEECDTPVATGVAPTTGVWR